MYIGSAIGVKLVVNVVVHHIVNHSCFACVMFQTLTKKSLPFCQATDKEIFPA
jgi:hypothetical protein